MVHENGQFDIPGIQLRESKTQPKVSLSREIGEAQITHTIFGKAKVRIIRKHDSLHRALWLTAAVVVTAIAAAIWQGWFTSQQSEPIRSADLNLPVSSGVQDSSPASQVENAAVASIVQPAAVSPLKREPGASSVPEIKSPAIAPKTTSQQPQAMKEGANVVAKPAMIQPKPVAVQPAPVASQPATTGRPHRAPLAAGNNVAKTVPEKPLPPKLIPYAAPAIAATPAAKPVAIQPAASSPGVALPAAAPLVKEDNSPQLPAGDNQLSSPINPQGK